MKSLVIIFGAVLLIIATPFIFAAIDDGISETKTESLSLITTGAGVGTANATLGTALYGNSVTSVSSISSNQTTDLPTASTFNSTDNNLLVSGLNAGLTRTLTIAYLIDHTTLATGQITLITMLRWFWVFMIIGTFGGAVYAFFD